MESAGFKGVLCSVKVFDFTTLAEILQMDPCYSMFLSLASHCHRPLGNCQARFATSPRFNPPSLPRIMVFHSTMAQIGCLWAHFPCWFRESDAFGQSIWPILPQARGAHGLSAEECTSVPPDFDDDPTCLMPALGLIQKTVIEHLRLEGGTAHGTFHQVLDFTVQNVVRR